LRALSVRAGRRGWTASRRPRQARGGVFADAVAGDVVGTEVCRDTMSRLVHVPAAMQHLADRNVPGFV
jgi:hypothetical protein